MKIGIDIRMINNSGIGTFIKNAFPLLINKMNNDTFVLIYNERTNNEYFKKFKNVEFLHMRSKVYSLFEQLEMIKINFLKFDLFISPNFNIPIFFNKRLIVVIHDIYFITKYNKSSFKKIYLSFFLKMINCKGTNIVTISNFTKNELISTTGYNKKDIHVNYNGVSNLFYKEKNNNIDRYILFVGSVKENKNLKVLIRAFEESNIGIKLFIVGNYETLRSADERIIQRAKSNSNIFLKGEANVDELRKYYSEAECLIFPSLYEGFGLPPIEAMSCGCPVVASKIPSLIEVCSNAALYFNPYDWEDLTKKIHILLNNQKIKNKIINRGFDNIKRFSWENNCNRLYEIIHK